VSLKCLIGTRNWKRLNKSATAIVLIVVVVVAVAVLVTHHCHYVSEPQYLTTINSVGVELPREVSEKLMNHDQKSHIFSVGMQIQQYC
jgi:flagellar biosynthesis/type III secretory pathway M-ring protein FliF/YscJ